MEETAVLVSDTREKKSIKILYNINEIKFNSTRMMKLGFRYNSTVTEENTIRSTFAAQKQPERAGF